MTNRAGDRATTLQHLSRDLVDPKWMYLKAVLSLIIYCPAAVFCYSIRRDGAPLYC